MGSVCCCLHATDTDEYVNPNTSDHQNCRCLRCVIQKFFIGCASLCQPRELHALPSSSEGATSLTSTASDDDSLSDMYSSPPRPLPYDADPRCFHLQQGGIVSSCEKGSSHSHEESELLRRGNNDAGRKSLSAGEKYSGVDEGGSKKYFSNPPMKPSSAKLETGIGYFYLSSEEEDVCPTCLEEYTEEDPKIMTRCSHHYHLGCIYEWMERSDSCPVCGKVMEFDESN